jgi:hypothetical protein
VKRLPAILLLLAAGCQLCRAAGARWELKFFHDAIDSELAIHDLAFPSERTGVAAGVLLEKGNAKPRVLVTRDGGRTWKLIETREVGLSLFFLREDLGWMVTERGIWRSTDGGSSWEKISRLRDLLRVCFLDDSHGYAVGAKKSAYETTDGGQNWVRLAAADLPDSRPERTVYGWIEFSSPRQGSIVGWSAPPRAEREALPDWMDPERAEKRRLHPTFTILIQTNDGGRSWRHSTTSLFGRITRLRTAPGGLALTLVEFHDRFEWPSEVYRIDLRQEKTERVYREKNRAVTDLIFAGRWVYLAAIEPAGKLRDSPVPGRLVMIRSENLTHWTEMEVDYRAFGRRAILAVAAGKDVWVATDTGMILRLAED